jgi:hypothetical protein
MSYSRDGGLSWTASRVPRVGVIGGQPVVQPNGNVVVPIDNASETALGYTISTNGGVKFGQAFTITSISAADDPGNIRSGPVSSADLGRRNDLRGLGGLSLPHRLPGQRPRLRHVHEWHDVVGRAADPDRRRHQHRRSLHPRRRGRQGDIRRRHPCRRDVLLLSGQELHGRDVCAFGRLHLLGEWRLLVELADDARRPDDHELAREHLAGAHGRRLHLDVIRLRRPREPVVFTGKVAPGLAAFKHR